MIIGMKEIRRDLIISSINRKQSDKKYNDKISSIPIRIPQELKDQIPSPKSTWIRELVISELGSESRIKTDNSRIKNNNSQNTELREYLVFFFKFFQKNASNIEITDLEREKVKKILEVLKSE